MHGIFDSHLSTSSQGWRPSRSGNTYSSEELNRSAHLRNWQETSQVVARNDGFWIRAFAQVSYLANGCLAAQEAGNALLAGYIVGNPVSETIAKVITEVTGDEEIYESYKETKKELNDFCETSIHAAVQNNISAVTNLVSADNTRISTAVRDAIDGGGRAVAQATQQIPPSIFVAAAITRN